MEHEVVDGWTLFRYRWGWSAVRRTTVVRFDGIGLKWMCCGGFAEFTPPTQPVLDRLRSLERVGWEGWLS